MSRSDKGLMPVKILLVLIVVGIISIYFLETKFLPKQSGGTAVLGETADSDSPGVPIMSPTPSADNSINTTDDNNTATPEPSATPTPTPTSTPTATPTPTGTPTPTPTPTPSPTAATASSSDATGEVFYGRGTANNKIGMYVNNTTSDIKAASKLINSNGGKWGYVLLTMALTDRNTSNWQDLMDAATKAQVIPIVQIANNSVCNSDKMDFKGLAKTLDSAKWPSKHMYVSIFNEMNSKDYWCDNISASGYAKALDKAVKAFKAQDKNFFILPGAFNSSARTQDRYTSEDTYLIQMNQAVPGIFKEINGWATHAYPQPNFSGDPHNLPSSYDARDTIYNYTWEMSVLKNDLGITGLPIFITETGWLHREGQDSCNEYSQSNLLSAATVAARYKDAYQTYWLNNPQIVAITPFIFRSSDKCAEGFAWQKQDGSWYPQATMLLNMKKTTGSPS